MKPEDVAYYVQIPINPREVNSVDFLIDGQMKYLRIVGTRQQVAEKLAELKKAVDTAVERHG